MTAEKEEIERLRHQQKALAEFGSFAFRESDLTRVLFEATRVCAELLDVPICKITRHRPDDRDLLIEAGVGLPDGCINHTSFYLDRDANSPPVMAFNSERPVIHSDLRNEPMTTSFYRDHLIISTVNVVISGSSGAYGVLQIDSTEQRTYSEHDIDFLRGFSNVLAEAISAHRRLTEQKNLADQMQVLLQELSHRVRNNLQVVHSMLDVASNDDRTAKESLTIIARRVFTLAQVYDHLLAHGVQPTVDLAAYLEALATSMSKMIDTIAIKCGQMDTVEVSLDVVTALGLAVTELITNSLKHAFAPGTRGTVTLSLVRREDGGILTVSDNGSGMRLDAQTRKRHGLGLVNRLIKQIKGNVAFSGEGEGTRVSIIFQPGKRRP